MDEEEQIVGTLAEEYHVASRNQLGYKHAVNKHQIHYSPKIQALASEAPMRLAGVPRVTLSKKKLSLNYSLEETIEKRISARNFANTTLSLEALSTILNSGTAVRRVDFGQDGKKRYQRRMPNSGNLGSVETFVIVSNVNNIPPGIYHFDSIAHDLAQIQTGNFSTWLANRIFYQIEYSKASVAIILTSAIGRLTAKYGQRGYRLGLLDVGHVSQNLNLTCTSLGLQVCTSAGFIDDELDAALGIDGLQIASMLVLLVGPQEAINPLEISGQSI